MTLSRAGHVGALLLLPLVALVACAEQGSSPIQEATRPPQVRPQAPAQPTVAQTARGTPSPTTAKQTSTTARAPSSPAAKPTDASSSRTASTSRQPPKTTTDQRPRAGSTDKSQPLPPPGRAKPTTPPKSQSAPIATAAAPKATTLEPRPDPRTDAERRSPNSAPTTSAPTYRELANAQNSRSGRLSRLWARAVASITFVDAQGNQKWEQGEGHFQVIQPSQMALSVGKLGEVFLWIGCDNVRYWLIDPKETKRAYVGRHDLITREKIDKLGLPVPPRDLIALAGISPLKPAGSASDPRPTRDADGLVRFDQTRDSARWRTGVDARTLDPRAIDLFDPQGQQIVAATLDDYKEVQIRGQGGFFPTVASRMKLVHLPSNSSITLTLSDPSDGGKNRLQPQAFDFDALIGLLGVREVIDLDEGS